MGIEAGGHEYPRWFEFVDHWTGDFVETTANHVTSCASGKWDVDCSIKGVQPTDLTDCTAAGKEWGLMR